jgi:peptidyl-prolyl cis-trans isomerase B (cyclophilin B)
MIAGLLSLATLTPTPTPLQDALIKVSFDQDAIAPETGEKVGVLTTSEGRIVVMFFPQVAPKHVKNFQDLADKAFYNGTRFHRCMPGFMIQGGDPNSADLARSNFWGTGGPVDAEGKRVGVNAEFSELKHNRGVLSMARASDPNSAGSQFFIMHANAPFLDGKYSAFGKVIEGLDVVDKIVKTGPTDRQANGSVPPEKAVVLQKVEIKAWPLSQ